MTTRPTVYVVVPGEADLATSFIRAQIDRLPAEVISVHGWVPTLASGPALSDGMMATAWRKIGRMIRRQPWEEEITRGYATAFRRRPAAVLAQYGTTGVRVMEACACEGVPLIVHFHGFDASVKAVLAEHVHTYPRLFQVAAAIVAVSHDMCERLVRLGAPPEKVHYAPCGVDCSQFVMSDAAAAPQIIVAAGRLVDKKAPHLTLLSFAEVLRECPDARLRLIGDGPLLGACGDLASGLGLGDSVDFLGQQPHHVIRDEMQNARCFVQHSVVALNGDSEGTPVAVMEAGASGLPVVATRHAGIGDVVVDGETGFLVEEHDIKGMARGLVRLMQDPALAARMGRAGRTQVEARFSMDDRVARLWEIIEAAVDGRAVSTLQGESRVTPLTAGA
jgi:colanic acid/amylovoran biosynthesis glycosyltransferase